MKLFSKWLYKYTEKRLKEIEEHPETNKDTGGISNEDFNFYATIVIILILVILFACGVRFYTITAPI